MHETTRSLRISALRRYIALLRQSENRLHQTQHSPMSNEFEVTSSATRLRTTAQKILSAEEELKVLELARLGPKRKTE